MVAQITHGKLNWQELKGKGEDVLAGWMTGQEVDLEDAVRFHQALPGHLNFGLRLAQAKEEGRTLASAPPGGGGGFIQSHCFVEIFAG